MKQRMHSQHINRSVWRAFAGVVAAVGAVLCGAARAAEEGDAVAREIAQCRQEGFPLMDLHVHLKGGLTLDDALQRSASNGIPYGIAVNGGLGFPVTNDAGIAAFADSLLGKPVWFALQAEGREWVRLFSPDAVARFDYVFTDAMTFTDERGRRTRLWIKEEVDIPDKQAFMDRYVAKIVEIVSREPIDIYVNATFLPACIAAEYDSLWTEARMDAVIAAARRHEVAIEINARYRIPSAAFIKRARQAGVKFTFGTNNSGPELGRLEYCLEMRKACGLTAADMFVPRRAL